jgi:hypothetical protein
MLDSCLRGNDKKRDENDKSPLFAFLNPLFTKLSDPLQECPFNARRVPLKGHQFSKNRQLRRFFEITTQNTYNMSSSHDPILRFFIFFLTVNRQPYHTVNAILILFEFRKVL